MKIFCTYLCNYKDRNDYYLSLLPYGITSIAAYLEQEGHEVILANLSSYGFLKGAELTLKNKPDVVAVSIFSFNRTESFKYIKQLKIINKSIIIIAGGHHPTFLYDEILSRFPEINFIIRGEGEYAIKNLIESSFKNNPSVITADRIQNINDLPSPSLFKGKMIGVNTFEQFKFIITSRGCPSDCAYCSSPNFWEKKVTYRNPELIIKELRLINKKYGIIYFSIRDDNFTLKKSRVLEFCHELEKSNLYMMWNCQARVDTVDEEMLISMKRSGLEHIQFGVESGSEKMLKLYNKQITPEKIKYTAMLSRKVGVYLSFYLMAGMPEENSTDINCTKKLLSVTRPHDVIISPVAYYPGTQIYIDHREKGLITDSYWFKNSSSGIYISPEKNKKIINDLLMYSSQISTRSSYTYNELLIHRSLTGDNCWMNYIFEADYYQSAHNIKKVTEIYYKMIEQYPDNIWGYLRLSELLLNDSPREVLLLLKKIRNITPSFYIAWYMAALIHLKINNISDAKKAIKRAIKLNPDDPEVITLANKIDNKL